MNGMALALMGGNADPDLIRLLTAQEKERRDRLEKLVVNLGKNVVTGYRYFKGAPKLLEAGTTTTKEIPAEDPRYAGLMAKYRQEEDIKFEAFENFVNSVVEITIEFSRPNAFEAEFFARMMSGGGRKDQRLSADSARYSG